MIIQRRKFLIGLGSLLAAPAIVSAANLMPVSAKLIVPVQYDLIVVKGQNALGEMVEEKFFDTSEENIRKSLSKFPAVHEVRKLQSIAQPWKFAEYDLRSDLLNAFKEHGF